MKKTILTALASLLIANVQAGNLSKGALIADSQEDLNAAVEVAASGDQEALNEMVADGKILFAEGPLQVFIVKAHPFEEWNPVEFRIKGKSKVFWTMGKYYHAD